MIYPSISEYVEAIKLAEENLDTLSSLRPLLDAGGNPVMSSGNFAVVFKMTDGAKVFALKCFTREQEGRADSYRKICDELEFVSSEYLVPIKYLENELYVDNKSSDTSEFPVLLMDWVEGETLDKWVGRNLGSKHSLQMLSYRFCRMASWLLSQPFAHGDIKPDNIVVKSDDSPVLVDYDGMFVPAMHGTQARELGSPGYRHPSRTVNDFDEHIDDFALAALAMQLNAIAHDPSLYAPEQGDTLYAPEQGDTLLLTEHDHSDIAGSDMHRRLHTLLSQPDFERLYGLYLLAHSLGTLGTVSFRAFLLPKPTTPPAEASLSTEVTAEDLANGVKDEYGAIYSADGLRLLEGVDLEQYRVRQGTKVICDEAFLLCKHLTYIYIPETVTYIGNKAFRECESLSTITIPESVTHIGDEAFLMCESLTAITIPKSVTHIGDSAFWQYFRLNIPLDVRVIDYRAFFDCGSLTSINIPLGSRSKFERMLPNYLHDKLKEA